MIVKGQKEPMFLISFRNKGEEVDDLRSNALFQILGGLGLAGVCLLILVFKAG